MKKGLRNLVFVLIMVLLILPLFTVTALAAEDDDEDEVNLEDILIPVPVVVTVDHEHRPLTPPGNLTLVDDADVVSIEEKQFMTVVTKNGNYFYIVVDRDGNGDNVYFLNLVDELDLYALLEDDVEPPPPPPPPPDPYVPIQEQPVEPEPEPEENKSGSIIALIVFLVIAGVGAAVYFKVIKPKQDANKSGSVMSLDDLSDDEDEYGGGNEYEDTDTGEDEVQEEFEEPEDPEEYEE